MPESRGPSPSPLERASPPDGSAPASATNELELERFYLEYFLPLVRRAVRRHGLSVPDAHDIVQDVFILAIAKLDGSKNPKAWLYQVLDHLTMNLLRKSSRRARLMDQWRGGVVSFQGRRERADEL